MYFYPRFPRVLLLLLENLSVQHVCWAGGQAYHFACQAKRQILLCFHFIGVFHGGSRGQSPPPQGHGKSSFRANELYFQGKNIHSGLLRIHQENLKDVRCMGLKKAPDVPSWLCTFRANFGSPPCHDRVRYAYGSSGNKNGRRINIVRPIF